MEFKGSASDPVKVVGFPGTIEGRKVAIAYDVTKHQGKDEEIRKYFFENVGECRGGRETARGNVDVGGFVILTFTKKTDVKDFEKNFGDKDILPDPIRIYVRDFESRGETYGGCEIRGGNLILHTRKAGLAQEVTFATGGEPKPW